MSEQTNKFTEEDIDNDGRIKRECGVKLRNIAKRNAPELYDAFAKVCDEKGVRPEDRFGHMVILALEDEGFAEELFYQEVDLSVIKGNQMAMEDVELVMDLADKLDIGEDNNQEDPIDELIRKRIESVGGSSLSGLSDTIEDATEGDSSDEELKTIKNQLTELTKKVEDNIDGETDEDSEDADVSTESEDRDLDEVFGSEGSNDTIEATVADDESEDADDNGPMVEIPEQSQKTEKNVMSTGGFEDEE